MKGYTYEQNFLNNFGVDVAVNYTYLFTLQSNYV